MGIESSVNLVQIIEKINNIEDVEMRIKGKLFVLKIQESKKKKIEELGMLLRENAKTYGIKEGSEEVVKIINKFKEKIESIYSSVYNSYVKIQEDFLKARLKLRFNAIKYQQVVNAQEKESKSLSAQKSEIVKKLNSISDQSEYQKVYKELLNLNSFNKKYEEKKKDIRANSKVYLQILEKNSKMLSELPSQFEEIINSEFHFNVYLQPVKENNFFSKFFQKIKNIFNGKERYLKTVQNYSEVIEKVNVEVINKRINNMIIKLAAINKVVFSKVA